MSLLFMVYILLVNIITFALYGIDKQRAVKQRYRISEATLLGLAFIGGSIGALAGMYVFHHKTRKPKFKIGVPLILLLHAVIFIFISF